MRGKMMLQKVIFYVKLSLSPIWCWPLSKDASKLEMTCVKLYHYLSIILAMISQPPVIYTIRNHLDDFLILIECMLELSSTIHSVTNFIFHGINKHRLQYVTFEMIHFSEVIKPHEDIIIQRYIDKCIIFHGVSMVTFYVAALIVIIAIPIVTSQPFPMSAEYPFNVHYQPLKSIIYLHHSVVGIHISAQLCTNIFMALLLWFASARFEILTDELRKTTDVYHLAKCIRKHQYLLKYTTEIILAVRPFALIAISCSTVCMVILCLLFLSNHSAGSLIIVKFIGLILGCLTEVFMYTWPAEHLIYKSQDVAQVVFDTPWYDRSIEVRRCLQIIIRRSQKPLTIAIACIMPTLSLNYFASSQDGAQAAFDTPWYDQSIEIRKCLQIIIGRSQTSIIITITGIMPTLSLSYFASYCLIVLSFFTTIRAFVSDEK